MKNIVLIGMPGSGKSTVGVLLAKRLSKDFVDTDILIQNRQRLPLQEIVDRHGYMRLREVEEEAIIGLRTRNTVVATGGSAVYSARAMRHLKSGGPAFYLKAEPGVLLERIGDLETRGIARAPGQSFEDLHREREALYLEYCDVVVECGAKSHEAVVREIAAIVRERFPGLLAPGTSRGGSRDDHGSKA